MSTPIALIYLRVSTSRQATRPALQAHFRNEVNWNEVVARTTVVALWTVRLVMAPEQVA